MIVAGFDSRVDVFLEQSLLQSELFFNLCCFVSTNLFIYCKIETMSDMACMDRKVIYSQVQGN